MKKSKITFFVVLLLTTASFAYGQIEKAPTKMSPDGKKASGKYDLIAKDRPDADGWKQYVSQTGDVKISFPDIPETNIEPIKENLFETESVQHLAEKDFLVFMMGFVNLKVEYSDKETLDDLFDSWQKGIEKNIPDNTAQQENFRFNSYPARKVKIKNSDTTADGIVFFAGKKMYHLLVFDFAADDKATAVEYAGLKNKFFNSFILTETTEAENIYSNPSLKFSLTLPKDWIEISSDTTAVILNFAKDNDKKLTDAGKRQIDESLDRTRVLFNYSKAPLGSASYIGALELNPNDSKTTMYQIALASQRAFVKNLGYEVVAPPKNTTLNGVSFYVLNMKKQAVDGATLYQRIYIRKMGAYLLEFVLTYKDEDSKQAMEDSLKTLKFTK